MGEVHSYSVKSMKLNLIFTRADRFAPGKDKELTQVTNDAIKHGLYDSLLGHQPPSVCIVLWGNYFNLRDRSAYAADVEHLVTTLDTWAKASPNHTAIIIETLPQHYDNQALNEYGNTFDPTQLAYEGSCAPIKGAHANTFRGDEIREGLRQWSSSGRVHFLPTNDIYASRWNLHPHSRIHGRAGTVDCTHYCWFSALWAPLWDRIANIVSQSQSAVGRR